VNFKLLAIEKFASWIIGGVPFHAMKNIVTELANTDHSNTYKRTIAIEQFKILGYSLADSLINLALELAVIWLKSKIK
jgi:hypothetical protein